MAYPSVRFFAEGDATRTPIMKLRALEHTPRMNDIVTLTPVGGPSVKYKVESIELDLSTNQGPTTGIDYLGAPLLWVSVSVVP